MKFEKKHFIYLLIGFGISLLILFLYYYTILFTNFELLSLDKMFYMRNSERRQMGNIVEKNPRLSENIVIVGIDEPSLKDLGRFPWPRQIYSRLLKRLANSKPAGVFFDIFLPEYSDTVNDQELVNGLAYYKKINNNVFFDYPFEHSSDPLDIAKIKQRYDLLLKTAFPITPEARQLKNYNHVSAPIPNVIRNANNIGHAVIEPDYDSYFRKIPLFVKFNNQLYPQVVTVLAMHYFSVKKEDVEIKIGKYVKFKNAKIKIFKRDDFGDIVGYKTKVEDIVIPVDNECKMTINFVGWPGEFKQQSQYISFSDAFKIPPEYFKDKILFIGMYAQGIAHDIWPTPHDIMYGIEINANAFNTIIRRDFITHIPGSVNTLIIILIGLMLGLLVPRLKIWQSSVLIVLLIVILFVVVFFIVFGMFNKIMLFATPVFTIIVAYIGTLLYRILTEEKEKKFIKARFGNYVSSKLVDELLKNPKALQLGGEDRQITVFFSDVRSFTTISEQLGEPQKLVALLNEYLSAMTEMIIQYDGTLDKYVGDEVMAFWGAPVPQKDHALLACRSAIAQIKYLEQVLHPIWEKENKPKLNIGIGINTGNMTVGNMGSKSRMDYTLMGDEVNLGARLEGTNKVYTTKIIISESTYEIVKNKVIARELDIIRVKGKNKPVRIFELMDMKDEEITVKPLT
ncbi:MAG: adenylate/guanylate cyclase domain-containing protein [Spirochaetes bacterium]|nr:adenylate/guanylate cyclase domain-containing protein [Spirochaetota bacterium]